MKVLIIDDSKATRFILSKMMSEVGFETIEAENGKRGLEQLSEHSDVTIALVDWNMPVMTGYEMIQQVRLDQRFDSVKLVMVTTETEMEQVIRALEAGANEYLMKPFTVEMVRDKLKLLGLTS